MKKIFLMLLLMLSCIGISSCNFLQNEPKYDNSDLEYLLLGKSEDKQSYIYTDEYKNFTSLVGDFSTGLSEKLISRYCNEYDRMAVSPISIYMALAMATGAASDDARLELSSALGMSYEMIEEYTKYLYSILNKEVYDDNNKLSYMVSLNNSIWLNQEMNYKQKGLELLRNSFYTDSYAAPFSSNNKAANKAVQDYVVRNTKGLIDNEYNFGVDTLFLLINTLYLKDAWNSIGQDLLFTKQQYDFKNNDNKVKSLKLLMGDYNVGKSQHEDGFDYFYTTTARNLKLYFIKPTTKSLEEVFNGNNLKMILNNTDYDFYNHELKEEYYTRCLFPEFEASFNEDIVPLLKEEYGISKIFRTDIANYDKVIDENCYTNSVIHQTKLIVDASGIEGAAVTIISNEGTSAPIEPYTKVFYDFILDQSFGYMITSGDTILFSGVVNNL